MWKVLDIKQIKQYSAERKNQQRQKKSLSQKHEVGVAFLHSPKLIFLKLKPSK
jgi:hypothetical protein